MLINTTRGAILEYNEYDLKLKSTLCKAIPKEMNDVSTEILAESSDYPNALYIKGLAECILGQFKECTETWSRIDNWENSIYKREDFAEALTRKFSKDFSSCIDGTGRGLSLCLEFAVKTAGDDVDVFDAVFKSLENRIYPNRREVFDYGAFKHGNRKYASSLVDMILYSMTFMPSVNDQIRMLEMGSEHFRKVNEDVCIKLFNIFAQYLDQIRNELVIRKSKLSDDELARIEEANCGNTENIEKLVNARELISDRIPVFDARKQRVPKYATKCICTYMDNFFGCN